MGRSSVDILKVLFEVTAYGSRTAWGCVNDHITFKSSILSGIYQKVGICWIINTQAWMLTPAASLMYPHSMTQMVLLISCWVSTTKTAHFSHWTNPTLGSLTLLRLQNCDPMAQTQLPELPTSVQLLQPKENDTNVGKMRPSNSWNHISRLWPRPSYDFLSQLQSPDLWEWTWGMFVAVHAWSTHN